MKNVVKIVALALVLVMAVGILASCGGLSGKYEGALGNTFEFKGSKVTVSNKYVDGVELTGTYKIEDDKITFDFVDEKDVENKDLKSFLGGLKGSQSFEKDGDTIKIGFLKYTKVK